MTESIHRRQFIGLVGLGGLSLAVSPLLRSSTLPQVVVVGGGFAGATCAKYLKLWGGSAVDVILIEEDANYVSPILSNLVLTGQQSIDDLTFEYSNLRNRYAVQTMHQQVAAIEADQKLVTLNSGQQIPYDRLVLAPGIDFIAAPGHDFAKVPHAWKAGAQTELLKSQLDSMPQNGDFVMSIPPSPYRCPPGPYERACVVADDLIRRGITGTVTVLDANPDIAVEKDIFGAKFIEYGVNYRPGSRVTSVNSDNRQVTFLNAADQTETLSADVLNIIPPHRAADIVMDAGLNTGNWAAVSPLTYESTSALDIHIIGDSQATIQPKAGHIGNAEAKVCADAILRLLQGYEPDPSPKTNSACYSPVSRTEASWLTAVYEYNQSTGLMQLVPGKGYPASGAPSRNNYESMYEWSGNLFADTFG